MQKQKLLGTPEPRRFFNFFGIFSAVFTAIVYALQLDFNMIINLPIFLINYTYKNIRTLENNAGNVANNLSKFRLWMPLVEHLVIHLLTLSVFVCDVSDYGSQELHAFPIRR